ncbi:MAG: hypothetical protein L0Y75_00630 [Acidobacteria bacterium]|nr:hypothetical protein [Acidobacteriota bacterium]
MGLTYVTVTLKSLGAKRKKYEANFLVGIGATDSLAPAAELRKIGVKPQGFCKVVREDLKPKTQNLKPINKTFVSSIEQWVEGLVYRF